MPTESPRSTLMFCAQTRSYSFKVSENTEVCPSPPKNVSEQPKQKTPVKQYGPQRVYSSLPKYNTPIRRPIKNPFNERILELFKAPTCSPDFCTSVASPAEPVKNGEFFWTAEDLWRIDPAPIDSPQTDLEDNIDEETESMAQEAIERYFQESHYILSPIGSPKPGVFTMRGTTPEFPTPKLPTPKNPSERAMSTPCTRYDSRRISKTSVGVQTTLSLAPNIPQSILELLKPYMNTLDDSQDNSGTFNSSSSNLRRKLLFNEFCESPDNSDGEANDEKKVVSRFLASDWTPDKVQSTADLLTKSPDISPIAEGAAKRRSNFFDFTQEMAIDCTTSPIKGDHQNDAHMSIDFGMESANDSLLLRRHSSQTSADTGYVTNASEKSDKSQPADLHRNTSTDTDLEKSLFRSYVCVGNTSSLDPGLTSTPALNKYKNKKL